MIKCFSISAALSVWLRPGQWHILHHAFPVSRVLEVNTVRCHECGQIEQVSHHEFTSGRGMTTKRKNRNCEWTENVSSTPESTTLDSFKTQLLVSKNKFNREGGPAKLREDKESEGVLQTNSTWKATWIFSPCQDHSHDTVVSEPEAVAVARPNSARRLGFD